MNKQLQAAIDAAKEGGLVLKKYWGNLKGSEHKSASIDLVTEADCESEKAIYHSLSKAFPDFGILGEEMGLNQQIASDYLWIVDPLDGTTNYTHQYPMVCISIALVHQGIPIEAVVYNPIMNELFYASKGKSAYLNDAVIHVSKTDCLEKSLLASGFAYDRKMNPDNNYSEFCRMTHLSQGVRRGGSAALDLAYVAAGRFDGYWERGIKSWDIAAGILLVQEAGGIATSYSNRPLDLNEGKIVATNGRIHLQLCHEIEIAQNKLIAIQN